MVGDTYTQTRDVTLPRGIGGNFFVYVLPNYDESRVRRGLVPLDRAAFRTRVYESSYDNLERERAVVTYREPDLQVVSINAPEDVVSGQAIQLEVLVENVGLRDTRQGAWTDRVYLSTDPSLDNGDIVLGEARRNEPLATGASYVSTIDVTIPDGIEGDFFILGFVDSNVIAVRRSIVGWW